MWLGPTRARPGSRSLLPQLANPEREILLVRLGDQPGLALNRHLIARIDPGDIISALERAIDAVSLRRGLKDDHRSVRHDFPHLSGDFHILVGELPGAVVFDR